MKAAAAWGTLFNSLFLYFSFECRLDVFNLQLDFSPFVRVFLYRITDVERLFGLYVTHLRTLAEGNAVHYIVRLVVYQFQLDVFLVSAHHFARAIIVYVLGNEDGLMVVRPERIELFQVEEELGRDITEVQLGVDVDGSACLFWQNVAGDILFEASREVRHVFNLHGKSGGIGMPSEIL